MSSSAFSLTLDIDRSNGRRVAVAVVCAGLLAAASLCLSGLNGWLMAFGALLVLAHSGFAASRAWAGTRDSITRILVSPDREIHLDLCGAGVRPAVLERHWVLPGLVAGLGFVTGDGRRRATIICRDRVPADSWRRLLVALRHPVAGGGGGSIASARQVGAGRLP